ncbi:MAG: ATP-binding cassette domain-containing protein, partial [Pseudomonadota bacterium]
MSERGLQLERLAIRLAGQPLAALDRAVAPGEVLTVMGPSGSGKSTLLGAITGTLAPSFRVEGRVLVDGADVTALPTHRRRIGIMMQDDVLFPHLSVGANLAFGLDAAVRGRTRRARVEEALAEAGLAGFAERDPATLSGGQRARVALMRTLLSAPRALMLDEPFSKLDTEMRAQIRSVVFEGARRHGLPTILVTHDRADAEAAGDDRAAR